MKHVVIVGGGFAGMRLARLLGKRENTRVTVINPSTNFRYTPALYRAASGFKSGTAWLPLEWMLLDTKNATLIVATVTKIDADKKNLTLQDGRKVDYDDVVFCMGSVTTYFNIPGIDAYAYGVKSSEEITELKIHLHHNILNPDKADKDYIVIGAGPTGAELSAVLGAHIKRIAKQHKTSAAHIKVHLIEAGPRVLGMMKPRASAYALKQLKRNGVRVHLNTQVQAETVHTLKTSIGVINTDNVIWTAGTANNPFFRQYPEIFPLNERGKVVVDSHLQVAPHIYVCGDNAGTQFSGLASTAIIHANYIARDLCKKYKGKKRKPHKEQYPAQVVPVGEKHAVFQYRGIVLVGRLMSYLRKAADIVGYTDILGIVKAYTIWRSTELERDACDICGK